MSKLGTQIKRTHQEMTQWRKENITKQNFCTSQTCVYVLARERVSWDNLLWQAQLSPQCSDFIFMEIFQRFDYFSLQDHKRVESALQQWGSMLRCCTVVLSKTTNTEWYLSTQQQIMCECYRAPLSGVIMLKEKSLFEAWRMTQKYIFQ